MKDLRSKNICVDKLNAKETNIDNLKVVSINGRNVKCDEQDIGSEIENNNFDTLVNGQPIKDPRINQDVFDVLLANAAAEYKSLQERLTLGREIIQQFERDKSCNTCGETGGVPLSIYGYITKPLISEKTCGFPGGTGPNVFSSEILAVQKMFYNLEVDYDVLVAQSVQPRVISILCHLAYMDPVDNTPIIQEIVIGNKQFLPTVDPVYGEMFSGSIPLNSDLVKEAATAMPNTNNCAAVQIVFYIEEGITIWTEKETLTDGRPGANTASLSEINRINNPPTPPGCEINVDFEYAVNGLTLTISNKTDIINGVTFTWYFWRFSSGCCGIQSSSTYIRFAWNL